MSIIRYNPLENWPSSFFGDDFFDHFRNSSTCKIPVDIYEKKGKVNLDFELPGLSKDNIDIELKNNTLTISGEFKKDDEIAEDNYYRKERFIGSFFRSFTLPTGVKEEDINAKFNNGILNVSFPKQRKEESRKKIEVK